MAALSATNLRNLEFARPSNVILANNVSNQFSDKQKHAATFPNKLVEFFIKSFSNEGDIVMDPFCGSGTVGVVAKKLNRNYILIDNKQEFVDLSIKRINDTIVEK
jgi:DNA modification methylase